MLYLITIIVLSLIEFLGDASLKLYNKGGGNMYLLSGTSAYALIVLGVIYTLKYSNVAYMNLLWDGMSILIETGLAMLLLHETLSNSAQYTGAIFLIIGVVLMNIGKIPTN